MADGVTIRVDAQTQAAGQNLQQFYKSAAAGGKQLEQNLNQLNQSLNKNGTASGRATSGVNALSKGMGNARTGMMQLQAVGFNTASALAAGINPARALATQMPELAQSALYLGFNLSRLVPALAAISVAAGGGILLWREYTRGEREAAEAAERLRKELAGVQEVTKAIQAQTKAGFMSAAAAEQFRKMLSGEIPLYRNRAGQITRSPTEVVPGVSQPAFPSPSVPLPSTLPDKTVQNARATAEEVQKYILETMNVQGRLDEIQVEAAIKLRELREKIHTESLSELDQEIAGIRERYQTERDAIAAHEVALGDLLTPKQQQLNIEAMELSLQNQQRDIAEARARAEEEAAARAEAALKRQQAETDKILDQLRQRREEELRAVERLRSMRDLTEQERLAALESISPGSTAVLREEIRHARALERINELVAAEQEKNALIEAEEEAHQVRLLSIQRQASERQKIQEEQIQGQKLNLQQDYLDSTASLLGSAAQTAALFGQQGFLAWKALALAQTQVSTAAAVMQQLSSGDPYSAWIRAAAAAAMGAIQTATIIATQPPGYALGGRPPPGRMSRVNESGPEFFVPDTAGTILPADRTAQILRGGADRGGPVGKAAGESGPSITIGAVNNSESDIKRFFASAEGEVYLLDWFNRRRLKLGVRT